MSVFKRNYLFFLAFFIGMLGCQQEDIELTSVDEGFVDALFGKWQPIEGQYIVVFKSSYEGARLVGDPAERLQNIKNQALDILAERSIDPAGLGKVYATALDGFSVKMEKAQAMDLAKDPKVAYIEQDQFIPLAPPAGKGPGSGGGGGGGGSSQTTPWGITRVNGVSSASGTAWVIDTGIDLDHPDLNVDVQRSKSFVSFGKDSKDANDGQGHGTHVAGTIAAIDNDFGVIGVAAGATVVAIKVLGTRGGTLSDVIAGVDHVAKNGSDGDVANMSLGGGVSPSLDDAVIEAAATGVKFVLAAGNESDDANNHSPARANGPNVYTISAMAEGDNWASFSNYGDPVDYCAPGVSILSCYKDGGYATASGTSMAAPHAAGVLLLGNVSTDGTVNGDPDGNADLIIVH